MFALFLNVPYSILAGEWYISNTSVKLSSICPFPPGASEALFPGKELKYYPTAQRALPLTDHRAHGFSSQGARIFLN